MLLAVIYRAWFLISALWAAIILVSEPNQPYDAERYAIALLPVLIGLALHWILFGRVIR